MPRRFRGLGHGRKTRRTLSRGGTGPAARLNEALAQWPGVRITPMFGRWGYFVGSRMFACYPVRPKQRDLWIHLDAADQRRALGDSRIRPHRRFSSKGWIELNVDEPGDVSLALRWLRQAYTAARTTKEDPHA